MIITSVMKSVMQSAMVDIFVLAHLEIPSAIEPQIAQKSTPQTNKSAKKNAAAHVTTSPTRP